jgi:hypothetical protein
MEYKVNSNVLNDIAKEFTDQMIIRGKNNLMFGMGLSIDKTPFLFEKIMHKHPDVITANHLYALWKLLEKYHSVVGKNSDLRKQYLEKYHFKNIKIIDCESRGSVSDEEFEKFWQDNVKTFLKSPKEFICAYEESKTNPNFDYNSSKLNKKMGGIMERIIAEHNLYSKAYAFSQLLIKQILNHGDHKFIFRSLEFIWLLKNQTLSYGADSQSINQDIIKGINNILNESVNEKIDLNSIKNFLKDNFSENDLSDYYSSAPQKRLGYIYTLRNNDQFIGPIKKSVPFFNAFKLKPSSKDRQLYERFIS